MAVRIKSKRQVDALCQLAKDAIYRDNETPTLYLRVRDTGSAQWTQIVHIEGKRVERGLGGWPVVTIEEAREVALGNRRALRRGENPFAKASVAKVAPTFAEAVEAVIAADCNAWKGGKDGKSAQQWRGSLRDYAMPTLGSMAVDAIQPADVVDCLKPIWQTKHVTALRVRQRIDKVMQWAIGKEYRADNPAAAVDAVLGKVKHTKTHHKALPYAAVPSALAAVRESKARPAVKMAFEFLVLTAARSGEVREATWPQIDKVRDLWKIEANDMKATRAHVVPLPEQAMDLLGDAAKLYDNTGLLFPSRKDDLLRDNVFNDLLDGLGIDAVPHGFRASFRTWAAEHGWPRDIAEVALAHEIPNAVEASYNHAQHLGKRKAMMRQWADYCLPKD